MSVFEHRTLFVFPGQGSQYPGIGSDLHAHSEAVRRVYEEASDLLGYDIAKLSFEDPDNHINLTRYTQPVLLTHQVACLTLCRELAQGPMEPDLVGGHSLGEYTALVAADVLTFADALKLVARRGELMGTLGEGEMAALTVDLETARPLADKHYCGIAGLNLPDQTVVGGSGKDLDRLVAEMEEKFPKKRAVRLKTEGAFHTYYMVNAAREFRNALDAVEFREPKVRVLSNYTGGFHEPEADSIRSRLFFQLFHPVNWIGCMQTALNDQVTLFVEFGGGIGTAEGPAEKRPNLESIIKKFTRSADPKPEYMAAINLATIQQTAAAFGK